MALKQRPQNSHTTPLKDESSPPRGLPYSGVPTQGQSPRLQSRCSEEDWLKMASGRPRLRPHGTWPVVVDSPCHSRWPSTNLDGPCHSRWPRANRSAFLRRVAADRTVARLRGLGAAASHPPPLPSFLSSTAREVSISVRAGVPATEVRAQCNLPPTVRSEEGWRFSLISGIKNQGSHINQKCNRGNRSARCRPGRDKARITEVIREMLEAK